MDSQTPPSPTYRIFRDKHGIPQFEPKRGTQALKDALIYSFPTLETELQLMQAALRKFFDSERGSTFVFELPERDLQTSLAKKPDVSISPLQSSKASLRSWKVSRASRTPSRPSSRASSRAPSRASSRCETPTPFSDVVVSGGTMTTWMLSNGQELEKRKRQPYDPVKRRKVAENRGNACEKHRASKTACNPEECPQNKLYGKTQQRSRRESEDSAYETPSDLTMIDTITEKNIADMIPYQILPSSDNPSHLELDVFFDALDSSVPSGAVGRPDHPAVNRDSASWTDSLVINEMSWSSSSVYTAIPESIYATPTKAANSIVQNMEQIVESQAMALDEHFPHETLGNQQLHAVPEEAHAIHESPISSTTCEQTLPIFNASDDPFMGWASKRASHLLDEYGWVLSHVEAL